MLMKYQYEQFYVDLYIQVPLILEGKMFMFSLT